MRLTALVFMALVSPAPAALPDLPSPDGPVGLHAASDFAVTTGDLSSIGPAPRLYFAKEWIAVPRDGVPVSDYARGVSADEDVRAWNATPEADERPGARPPLVWLGSPDRIAHARLDPGLARLDAGGRGEPLRLAPRLPSNGSWVDASTGPWYAAREVTLRGRRVDGVFEARTLWPEDFRLDPAAPVVPLASTLPPAAALRDRVRSAGADARGEFAAQVLWERQDRTRAWEGKPVLLVMVNGAQGDDDEAWGGHFAIGTGRLGNDGSIGDILVDNFYSLDVVSEKGILAAPVPLDNYLADLNSGQAWYRPSAMLVAILADDAAPALVQGALNRVYAQFWRHQLPYRHSMMNCTGISVDTLRALGWNVPANEARASSIALAWRSVPWTLARERSVSQARIAYEYLTQDRTRLFPAVAFETIGAELLRLAQGGTDAAASDVERLLARDLEALVFVRVPQLPSSRAFGSWPVVSPAEYHGKVPRDPEERQIVPVPPRPFPSDLREADLLPETRRPSDLPLAAWALVGFAIAAALVAWAVRSLAH